MPQRCVVFDCSRAHYCQVPGTRYKSKNECSTCGRPHSTSINIEAGRVKLFTVNAACIVISVKVKIRIHDVGHTFYLFRFDI